MKSPALDQAFNAAHAAVYDSKFETLHALKDALHLLIQAHFSALPPDARILVAGAGTGAEVRFLAPVFPGWTFTLADPAEAMLEVARRHAENEGFLDRCVFHHGYVSSLPKQRYHGAISVLVSHFLTDRGERESYFGDIAERLGKGALLFNADLCADRSDAAFERVMDLWLDALSLAAPMPDDARANYRAAFGRDFAAQGPDEVAAIIERAGFEPPVPCYQFALIRGWVSRRRPSQ